MKKLLYCLVFTLLSFSMSAEITVPTKNTGDGLTASEFSQLIEALRYQTRTIHPEAITTNGTITASAFVGSGASLTGIATAFTVQTANISSTANISLTANIALTANYAVSADLLDGQTGTYYQNASNINAGTLGQFYLPSTSVSSNYFSGVSINGTISANKFIGSGAELSGLPVTGISTANADLRYVSPNYYQNTTINVTANFIGGAFFQDNKPVVFSALGADGYGAGIKYSSDGSEGLFIGVKHPNTKIHIENGWTAEETPSFNSVKEFTIGNEKVGILNNNPRIALDVNGAISANSITLKDFVTANQLLAVGITSNYGYFSDGMTVGSGADAVNVDADGNTTFAGNVTANGSFYVTNYLNLPATPIRFEIGAYGGVTPDKGTYGTYRVMEPLTMTNWWMDGNTTGNVTVDVQINGVSAVGAGTKPSLVSQLTNTGAVDWDTVDLAINDIIRFKIDEDIALIEHLTLTIRVIQQ